MNISALYTELQKQAAQLPIAIEMIWIDDASQPYYQAINRQTIANGTYIQLEKNVGRAAIRNLFLRYASNPYLLFLDCDSIVIGNDFLLRYLSVVQEEKSLKVICGGRVYPVQKPARQFLLRWQYGRKRESRSAIERNQFSNAAFQSNNFLIPAEVFSKVQFDERLTKYGHEDTLFGYELQKNGVDIYHIDNPVLNGHLETNERYLQQTEQGIKNLVQILRYVNYDASFINEVTLLRTYYKLSKHRNLIRLVFSASRPFVKKLLIRGFFTLRLFDWYKLGLLAQHLYNNTTTQREN